MVFRKKKKDQVSVPGQQTVPEVIHFKLTYSMMWCLHAYGCRQQTVISDSNYWITRCRSGSVWFSTHAVGSQLPDTVSDGLPMYEGAEPIYICSPPTLGCYGSYSLCVCVLPLEMKPAVISVNTTNLPVLYAQHKGLPPPITDIARCGRPKMKIPHDVMIIYFLTCSNLL